MTEKIIKDLKELKQLASRDGGVDCYIKLGFGGRSSKHIDYNPGDKTFTGTWYIYNEIDDTEETYESDEELTENTNIPEAISKHALILEDYSN